MVLTYSVGCHYYICTQGFLRTSNWLQHTVHASYIVTALAWLAVSIYNMNYKKNDQTMKKSWNEYLKRLANDKVSNLLLSIMFLFDAVHFAFIEDSKIFLYISFLPLVLDIIWCDVVLYKRDIRLSKTTNNILKYLTYTVCLAIAVIVIIGAIN